MATRGGIVGHTISTHTASEGPVKIFDTATAIIPIADCGANTTEVCS